MNGLFQPAIGAPPVGGSWAAEKNAEKRGGELLIFRGDRAALGFLAVLDQPKCEAIRQLAGNARAAIES